MNLITLHRSVLFLSLTLLTACGGTDKPGKTSTKAIKDSRCLKKETLAETKIPVTHNNNACILKDSATAESFTLLVREGQNVDLAFKKTGNNLYVDFIQATEQLRKNVQGNLKVQTQATKIRYQWKANPETNSTRYTLTNPTPSNANFRFRGEDVKATYRFSLYSEILIYDTQTGKNLRRVNGPTSPRFSLYFDVDEID